MIRYAVAAVIVLAVALGFQTWRLNGAQADRDAALMIVAAHERAAEALRVEVVRMERERVEAATLDRELQEGVGADAPLSDYLRHSAGRVWP